MKKNKKVKIKSVFIILFAVIIGGALGVDTITRIIYKKFLFTPYNTTGIIMTICSCCGLYINKKQSHWIRKTLSIIFGSVSFFSSLGIIFSWLNLDLRSFIFNLLLKYIAAPVLTVIFWIVVGVIGLAVLVLIIYNLFYFLSFIKERKNKKAKAKVVETIEYFDIELVNNISDQHINNQIINSNKEILE